MRFSTHCDLQVQRLYWALSVKDKIRMSWKRSEVKWRSWSKGMVTSPNFSLVQTCFITTNKYTHMQCSIPVLSKVQQDIGFLGNDPVTDLRGIGMLGLECLQYPLCSNQLLWPPVLMFPWHYPLQLFLCQPSRQSSWSALSLTPSYMP